MINGLINEIISHGDRGAIVPYFRINDLKKNMLDLKNGVLHTDWLDRMVNHITGDDDKFIPSGISFEPRSMITIIIPSPKAILMFDYRGKSIPCVLPPHYANWNLKNKQALEYLERYLSTHGYSVVMAVTLPHKMLAVHTGLALYGRNNICYNNEFGSHMQIMTYLSDLPCAEDIWSPIKRMEICEKCHACVTSCPTGAIGSSHLLVNSDKCITVVNEFPEKYPDGFPKWIDEKAHNSIVGCSACQDCCPGNAHIGMYATTGVTFTEEETMEILNNNGNTPYTDTIFAKLDNIGMLQEYTNPMVMTRNLTMLLQKAFS